MEFTCVWPKEVTNVDLLHRKWLNSNGDHRIYEEHPKLVGFEKFLKNLRRHANSSVESTCRIPLPFQVESHIYDRHNIQFLESNTRLAYIYRTSRCEHRFEATRWERGV